MEDGLVNVKYFNNAATSWPKPESVYLAVDNFNRHIWANPGRGSSSNTLEAGEVLLDTREALAKLFRFEDLSRVIFTKNVTESINTVLKGYLNTGDHVIISGMEHNAVARPLNTMEKNGVQVSVVSCTPDGSLDPADIEAVWRKNTRMVCMLHASNLTGTIMPVSEVGEIVRKNGAVFLVDAAQTAGILPIDVEKQRIDILAFTGHKGLFGPQGTGGFYARTGLEIRPLVEGGTGSLSEEFSQPLFLPDRFEGGTPNTPGIAGLGAGIKFVLQTGVEKIRRHEQHLTDLLINGFKGIKGVTVYGPGDSRLQTAVVSINIEGLDCGELSFLLDQKYGIISRSGLHCAPMAHRTVGTLKQGSCRFSPGFFNSSEDIEKVVHAVEEIVWSNC
jgi:cysteine desulfurase family protein